MKTTARWLERLNPDAAASLREGMEETLTVVRLGVPELLRRTLATTNPIESAFSVAENVIWHNYSKHWTVLFLERGLTKNERSQDNVPRNRLPLFNCQRDILS